MKPNVIFLCTGNSCRSQMAEGWARHLHGHKIAVFSAGLLAKGLDPRAAQVMAEAGVNISKQESNSIQELSPGLHFDLVVTVCDHAQEHCPVLPGSGKTLHRSFPDPPALAAGEHDAQRALDHYRQVRDGIREFVAELNL